MDKFEKYNKTKNEIHKNQEKNVFDQNFNEISTFRAPADTKTPKNQPSTITRCHNGPKIQKHTDHFGIFPVPDAPFELPHR